MKIILSASNALSKWLAKSLSEPLPRMTGPDEKMVGKRPLHTNIHQVSWQCHVLANNYNNPYDGYTFIATEAFSRHTLFKHYGFAPSIDELEQDFLALWYSELDMHCRINNILHDDQLKRLGVQFDEQPKIVEWYRNTDLSVQGHVSDAGLWLRAYLDENNASQLCVKKGFALGLYVNEKPKRIGKKHKNSEIFVPAVCFINDGLFRFARGMNSFTPDIDDFPNPYIDKAEDGAGKPEKPKPDALKVKNNILVMADFKAKAKH